MKKNKQLVINLEAANLTQKQLDELQAIIHDTLAAMVKKSKPAAAKKDPAIKKTRGVAAAAVKTANLIVEFNDVDAGLSDFTATCNGTEKTIHESDTISFDNVKVNDIIIIKGSGAGSKKVTITGVHASPSSMSFAAGQHINGIFLINA